jgi:GTP-binding protein YchF
MGFKCGIVGLPNVGKSTLFNALTQTAAAEAANYPFCTIEPNIGEVGVPDERLSKLAGIAKSAQTIPTRLTFVDIAGLVRGASKGEGLGNQFLGHIREVDAIAYVLRCFEDGDVTHVEGRIDPTADAETVETELMLADLESLEKRRSTIEKKAMTGDKEAKAQVAIIDKALVLLREGKPARLAELSAEEEVTYAALQLLTAKPVLYVCNVDEASAATGNAHSRAVEEKATVEGAGCVVISAKIVTYFTVGPKEARAWTVTHGTKAPQSAGVIHTDFEKGFIRAETIAYDDYVNLGGETGAKDAGKMRLEGKEYVVKDGDVMHFRFAN